MKPKPTHPGECFFEDVFNEIKCSIESMSEKLGIEKSKLERFLQGKESMDDSLIESVARFTGTTEESWRAMQKKYDNWVADQ